MKLIDLEKMSERSRMAHQLFCTKRCFGPDSTLGILEKDGETCFYRTFTELAKAGHCRWHLVHLDTYKIPAISEVLNDETEVFQDRFQDEPRSPWDIARQKQTEARARATEHRRQGKQA